MRQNRTDWMIVAAACAVFVVAGTFFLRASAPGPAEPATISLPAAMAVQPDVDSFGHANPDYKDAAILALQYEVRTLRRELTARELHDDSVHRGSLVRWEDRCSQR